MYEIRRPPDQNFFCSLSPSWNSELVLHTAPFFLACEQFLFFFRFSEGRARTGASSGEAARQRGGRLAPSVTRVVICVSRAFCSMDQSLLVV